MVLLTSGAGYGHTSLNAFDCALLDAGVGNFNLIKVSSIVPPGATIEKSRRKLSEIPDGSLVNTVYTYSISNFENKTVSSVLAAAVSKNQGVGVIFENSSDKVGFKKLEKTVLEMIKEAFEKRQTELDEVIYSSSQIRVKNGYACAVSLAILI